MYHISDIKKFLRCELLYLYGRNEKNNFIQYLRFDENLNELLLKYFNIDFYFLGIRNDDGNRVINEFNNYDWFFHPRFIDLDLRINIPIMHKVGNSFDIYFIYYGSQIKELDLLTYRISIKLLEKKNININEIYIIYFNENYVNSGTLNVNELFKITNIFKNKRILSIVKEKLYDYENIIDKMNNSSLENSRIQKNNNCKQFGLCEYYDKCFPEENELADDSILYLVSSRNKNLMYENGTKYLKDANPEMIEGTKVQYAQIMASKNNGIYYDNFALNNFLNKLNDRPISFIDFEWDRYLVPPYKGMRPLDVVCFEFALYYLDEDNHLEHRTFVSTGDCRLEFVEALINYLPSKGPIVAYNSFGAECLRINELANMFPQYHDELMKINKRFVDLAKPFTDGLIYDIRMRGNFSLKKIVDICSDYSYDNLNINDGMSAVLSWRSMDNKHNENEYEIINNLKKYCSLDAYGLFLIYKWLIQIVVESNIKGGTNL